MVEIVSISSGLVNEPTWRNPVRHAKALAAIGGVGAKQA
jgi:hypothetical protein